MDDFVLRITIVSMLLLFTQTLFGQKGDIPDNVDSAYMMVERLGSINYPDYLDTITFSSPYYQEAKRQKRIAMENAAMSYRAAGIKFWSKFLYDERRYEWFARTVVSGSQCNYWKNPDRAVDSLERNEGSLMAYNADLNYAELWQWDIIYPVLRHEYINYINSKKEGLGSLFSEGIMAISEVAAFFNLARNLNYRVQPFLSTARIEDVVMKRYATFRDENKQMKERFIRVISYPILSGYRFLGLNEDSVLNLFSAIMKNGDVDSVMQAWVEKSTRLLNIFKVPVNWNIALANGSEFNYSKWRSAYSVVLVDIWTLNCSSCIRRMEYLRKLYEKYASKGFGILSLCANDMDDKEKVDRLIGKLELDWPILMIGSPSSSSFAQEIWNEYGFQGVPQMFLLDHHGRVKLYNHELVAGDLEPYILELIGKN